MLVDYRHSLLEAAGPNLLEHAFHSSALRQHVDAVVPALKKRMPGPDLTPEQLKNRSWWTGPELFVVVDDYELVVTQGNNPLAPLAEFVPLARDLGLHIVLARSSGGAARALYEPLISRMREVASPGLAMSANKDEGQLVGNVRSRPLPPGRGTLVSRRQGTRVVQTASLPVED